PECLVAVDVAEHDAAADHDAPVRALAPVIGEAGEQRRRIDILLEGLETDGVAVEVDITPLDGVRVDGDGCFGFPGAGHDGLLGGIAVTPWRREISAHDVS